MSLLSIALTPAGAGSVAKAGDHGYAQVRIQYRVRNDPDDGGDGADGPPGGSRRRTALLLLLAEKIVSKSRS
jgi:hypothetical protein